MRKLFLTTAASLALVGAALVSTDANAQRGDRGGGDRSFSADRGGRTAGDGQGRATFRDRSVDRSDIGRSRDNDGTRRFSGSQQRGDGHWDGRHRRHFRHGHGPAFGFGFGGPFYYDYGYVDSCYEWRQVRTRYGWRWAQVNVCVY